MFSWRLPNFLKHFCQTYKHFFEKRLWVCIKSRNNLKDVTSFMNDPSWMKFLLYRWICWRYVVSCYFVVALKRLLFDLTRFFKVTSDSKKPNVPVRASRTPDTSSTWSTRRSWSELTTRPTSCWRWPSARTSPTGRQFTSPLIWLKDITVRSPGKTRLRWSVNMEKSRFVFGLVLFFVLKATDKPT